MSSVLRGFVTLLSIAALHVLAQPAAAADLAAGFEEGTPEIRSISSLEFGPDGILFIGDSKAGAVWAIDTGDREPGNREGYFSIADVEAKLAALVGTTADQVLIHDMAVNPVSRVAYLSVSRGRSAWNSRWELPNDLADAGIVLRIHPDESIDELKLEGVRFARAELPSPVDLAKEHRWKEGTSLRVDAITDLVYDGGRIYVSGLSNEEFAAALWQVDFPFADQPTMTTVEIFHGAHGEWETMAPIRSFLLYELGGEPHVLASYLCTPLVTFPAEGLENGRHLKGKTVAEFGSGNYPIDMVLTRHDDEEFIVMSNSMLPLMTFSTAEVESFNSKPGITRESPTYAEGVGFVPRAGSGVQQLDNFNDESLLALQRMPSGKLDLVSLSIERLAL